MGAVNLIEVVLEEACYGQLMWATPFVMTPMQVWVSKIVFDYAWIERQQQRQLQAPGLPYCEESVVVMPSHAERPAEKSVDTRLSVDEEAAYRLVLATC